jgi:betaine-aldehyde dehydrogenase
LSPLTTIEVGRLCLEAGIPNGVVNVLPGTGTTAGEPLVASPLVDKVAFTGSTEVGRRIMQLSAENIKKVTLELGGKSAAIICDDADLSEVMTGLRTASFNVSGQACIAQTRILAPRRRYDEVVDALAGMAGELRVGDPNDPQTEVGPLVSDTHRNRVRSYIDIGEREGARLVTGGTAPPPGLSRGWYVSPTIFAGVSNDMRIAQEEIFGPVLGVIPYDDDAHAVAIANDSIYGLSGSVWTTDPDRGDTIARQVRTGMIGVNGFRPHFSMPFGGVKASGIGREFGREGIDAYVESKSYYRALTA